MGISIKDKVRILSHRYSIVDKIWNIVWWIDVKRRMLQYSDYEFCQKMWMEAYGREPNFDNPKSYDEKLWFLKLSNRDPLITQCSDKHAVREYVKRCGYDDILKIEYGFYNNAGEIDFSSLPSPSYLKCNHASGMNWIYRKERNNNISHIKWKFNFLLRQNPYYLSREWNYKNIKTGIVCEELLEMPGGDIPELQFFCFNGTPRFVMYNVGLADSNGNHKLATRWVFDIDYNLLSIKTSQPTNDKPPIKPENYERMVEIATQLSKPFPHVRVDLFNINGMIYFNELTFYSGGGFVKLEPEKWQYRIGSWLNIEGYKISEDAKKKHIIKELL